MRDNPILIGITLGMALFLFAPIVAMMFFPKECILPTFLGIAIDIVFLLVGFRIF
jgi:hypothetical protein